jgi:hypothetical protein
MDGGLDGWIDVWTRMNRYTEEWVDVRMDGYVDGEEEMRTRYTEALIWSCVIATELPFGCINTKATCSVRRQRRQELLCLECDDLATRRLEK